MKTFTAILLRRIIHVTLITFLGSCTEDDTLQNGPLAVSGISPVSGVKTTLVTITGTGFSDKDGQNSVTLNDLVCPVSFVSAKALQVSVPAKAGSGRMIVKVNGKTADTPLFTYMESADEISLTIAGISPVTGPKLTVITIVGKGFSAKGADNSVTINDIPCALIASSTTELKVTIPFKAGSGKFVVKVNGDSAETPPFTYIPEVIITTLAGSTAGEAKVFSSPGGVDVDHDSNFYVSDFWSHKIKKVTKIRCCDHISGHCPWRRFRLSQRGGCG